MITSQTEQVNRLTVHTANDKYVVHYYKQCHAYATVISQSNERIDYIKKTNTF